MRGKLRSLLREKVVKNSMLYGTTTLVAGVFGYLFQFVISRRLSVAAYGEFQSLNSLFAVFGAGTVALNYFFLKFFPVFAKARDYEAQRQFMAWIGKKIWLIVGVFAAVFLALTPLLQWALHLGTPWGLMFVMIAIVLSIWGSRYSAALTGWEYFFAAGSIAVAAAVAKLVSGYLIALHAPAATLILATFVISVAVSTAFAYYLNKRWFSAARGVKAGTVAAPAPTAAGPASPSWRERYYASFDIKKNTYAILVFSLLIALASNADVLLVKNLTSAELTGFYGALRTLGAIILTLNGVIVTVVLPAACAEGHDRKSLNARIIFFAYAGIFLISAGSTALFALFPKLLMGMLFGPQYLSVAPNLWLFGPLVFFLSVLTMEANFSYARHDYAVCLFLFLALGLTAAGIATFHATIGEVALATTASLALGWLAIFLFNLSRRRRQILEVTVPEGI